MACMYCMLNYIFIGDVFFITLGFPVSRDQASVRLSWPSNTYSGINSPNIRLKHQSFILLFAVNVHNIVQRIMEPLLLFSN